MIRIRHLLCMGAIACNGLGAAAQAHGDHDDDPSLRELSAQWWQWVLSIPAAVNPVTDATGAYCMVGQRGPVWFLAGSTTGKPTRRTCTVPEGMPIFFPVLNFVWVNTPDCDGQDLSVAEARAVAGKDIDGVGRLSVLLDNRPVREIRRVRSEVFTTVFSPDNLFGGNSPCPAPGKPYWPSVDNGYYVKLRGLREGTHHLSIQASNASGFAVDVFYTLNVVKARPDGRDR